MAPASPPPLATRCPTSSVWVLVTGDAPDTKSERAVGCRIWRLSRRLKRQSAIQQCRRIWRGHWIVGERRRHHVCCWYANRQRNHTNNPTETRNNGAVAFPGALIVNTTETASAAATKVVDSKPAAILAAERKQGGHNATDGHQQHWIQRKRKRLALGALWRCRWWHVDLRFGIGWSNVNLTLGAGESLDRWFW